MTPQPDQHATQEFLSSFRPGGPWVLTAIAPSKKGIWVRTCKTHEQVIEFLNEHQAEHNLYFQVNPLLHDVRKKAERQDVAALAWLHVDVDPRVGEDLAAEHKRIRALFETRLPPGVQPPTCLVFSGGGFQGFWHLRLPMQIDGQEEAYEEAARFNQQLELLFAADHCHNVDRIMRLPGTINWPDEKKKAKGRVPALAEVVWFNANVAYDLGVFTKAAQVDRGADAGFASHKVKVSGNVARVQSVHDLGDKVSDKCKVVIVQGHDPDNTAKHDSRSEWLFFVCCELVRSGVDDDTIFSIITDPEFRISESVLGKGSSAKRYALRQIERARDHAVNPLLQELNQKHAVVRSVGGKCRIISEEEDPTLNRSKITFQTFTDFTQFYCNRHVETEGPKGPQRTALGNWWVHHPDRRQYDTITFAPGHDVPGAYNLWRGFAFDAVPGRSCKKLLTHILENVCGSSQELYDYVIRWMANVVQHPNGPGNVALVMRGRQGTGKGFVAKAFGRLFGRHFLHVANAEHLVGQFNAHLRDAVVLFADEAFYAGDKRHESILKTIVTEETIAIEAKGVDVELAPNYVHLLMASNDNWVVPAGFDERRFLVLDVGNAKMQDSGYFAAIQAELDAGGYAALLHHLSAFDLTGFDVRRAPKTSALQEQKVMSFSQEEEWWFNKIREGEVLPGKGWPSYAFSSHLAHDFSEFLKRWSRGGRSSSTRFGLLLKRIMPEDWRAKTRVAGTHAVICEDGQERSIQRPWAVQLPSLDDCRRIWDRNFGGPYDWPNAPPEKDLPEDERTF